MRVDFLFLKYSRLHITFFKGIRMSFLNSSTSFTRLRIVDPVPASLWAEVNDKLRQFGCKDIDDLPEQQSFGWTAFDDLLDTDFYATPVDNGEFLAFAFRLDTRRIPAGVIKKHLALALKKEEKQNQEQGKKFIGKERKQELKEQTMLRLRMRFLPVPAHFQVVWNTTTGMVYFASAQQKVVEMFQQLFTQSFGLHLEALTPYELALKITQDPSLLDNLEPTKLA